MEPVTALVTADPATTAVFLSVVANRVVEAVVVPVRTRYPKLDLWWLLYGTWIIGGLLSYLAQVNLFATIFPDQFVGRVLTAILVGGGSNLLSDVLDWVKTSTRSLRVFNS